MSYPFTKAGKNASIFGNAFDLNDVLVTSVSFANTASSTATITHGLTGTPDWVLWNPGTDNTPTISLATINSTSIVFTRTATTTSGTSAIYVLAADLVG